MTIPAPSFEAAIVALVSVITSTVDDTSVLVSDGPPGTYQPDDMIVVGEGVDEDYTPHALVGDGGAGAFHEDFTISVAVDVYRGGDDFATTRARCAALVASVHAAIRGDMSLAGTVYKAEPLTNRYAQTWDDEHKGTRVRCDTAVHCMAIN